MPSEEGLMGQAKCKEVAGRWAFPQPIINGLQLWVWHPVCLIRAGTTVEEGAVYHRVQWRATEGRIRGSGGYRWEWRGTPGWGERYWWGTWSSPSSLAFGCKGGRGWDLRCYYCCSSSKKTVGHRKGRRGDFPEMEKRQYAWERILNPEEAAEEEDGI